MNHPSCLLLLVAMLAGCASSPTANKPPPPDGSTAIVRPDSRVRGRIKSVNQQGQYAIVDFGLGTIPPLQSKLNIYRGKSDRVVGVLRLTGPARQNIVAGDIISGEGEPGDEVIWDTTSGQKKNETDEPLE